ncbi:MAG: hypothetical protein QOJ64_1544 [Acidobacteriota bacterium]|jgi:hypothetical protein|nr:hypothetical protein [Acidobacteriota bacterium]
MRNKLLALALIAVLMGIDVSALANRINVAAVLIPDGIPAASQRHKRRRSASVRRGRRATRVYSIKMGSEGGPMPKSAEPATEEFPVTGAAPNVAPAPAPVPAPPTQMRAPGGSGPRIKPPTVQIKPPTE